MKLNMNNPSQKSNRLWWTLLAAPILALILIIVASVYFGIVTQGQNVEAIPQMVADSTRISWWHYRSGCYSF